MDADTEIIIVMTGLGLMIGKQNTGWLVDPLLVNIQPSETAGKLSVSFQPIIGDPDIFYYTTSPWYVCKDIGLRDAYTRAVSNIILPSTPVIH
jgi:hypothetical protein